MVVMNNVACTPGKVRCRIRCGVRLTVGDCAGEYASEEQALRSKLR